MKKASIRALIAAVITIIVGAVYFYVALPALNVFNQGFWIGILMALVLFTVIFSLLSLKFKITESTVYGKNGKKKKSFFEFDGKKIAITAIILAIIPLVVLIAGNVFASTFFNAEKYSSIIEVPEAVFEEDMPEAEIVNNIALMDTATARMMGARTLGSLSEVVSQYEISPEYRQINYQKTPQKIATLEYADFFRWLSNRENGVPGYVMVDPVNVTEAKYVKLSSPIKYTDSAFFGDDLHRRLRMAYPTKIFGSYSFEIDDEGNPYYIVSCMKPKVFMFGAMDVNEAIIFNPIDGTSNIYALSDIPAWVDNVFTGDHAAQKYNWYGTLKNGYWNSVIGKKDCKVTTDDFGYIVIEDDVWFFTGITSVTSDESNIGFIISNARTGEYKFYPVNGAEEYSAMDAARGEVQEKGYVASFPSLINVSGKATYITVLKDNAGLVKLYALVNVEKHSIVATGETQREAKEEYIRLLKQNGMIETEVKDEEVIPTAEASITVAGIRSVTVEGNSVMYITGDDGYLYKQKVADDESIMLIETGSKLKITYRTTEVEKIRQISAWSIDTNE